MPATTFVAAFLVFLTLFLRFPVLYDGDSYFHLAAARLFQDGIPSGLSWARFSVMHDGWGDKELLFHVLLMPFTLVGDPAVGGRVALALLNASLLTTLSGISWRAVGRWGLLVGPAVYLLQPDFLNRAFRLRPELLAVTLLVVMIHMAGTRRHVALAVTAFAFALGYTAFHVPVGLSVLWALWDRVDRKRWDLRAPLAVGGGSALALLLHPHFPKNLEIWWIQNVRFFEMKGQLDVGEEIFAPDPIRIVLSNVGLLMFLAVLRLSSEPRESREDTRDGRASFFFISAAAFAVLYLAMARMVTWMAPLVALAVVTSMTGRVISSHATIRGRRIPLGLVALLALLVALPRTANPEMLRALRHPELVTNEAELARFGSHVPPGAKVAATWRDGEVYAFYAPEAYYLNVLDPIFMAIPHPEAFATHVAVFSGAEPDVPAVLRSTLDSEYLAFDRVESPVLWERVRRDPRFELLHAERNVLARVRSDDSFVREWVASGGETLTPGGLGSAGAAGAFVDLGWLASGPGCVSVVHDLGVPAPAVKVIEFAPWGTGHVEIDGQRTGFVTRPARAILGAGARIAADLGEGRHRVEVTSCADQGRNGFYLRVE